MGFKAKYWVQIANSTVQIMKHFFFILQITKYDMRFKLMNARIFLGIFVVTRIWAFHSKIV